MKKGQRVLVRAFPDMEIERIVWEVGNTYVAVCRPEVYEDIKNLGGLPKQVMGFPKGRYSKSVELAFIPSSLSSFLSYLFSFFRCKFFHTCFSTL